MTKYGSVSVGLLIAAVIGIAAPANADDVAVPVPAECATINTAPYSAPESLTLKSGTRVVRFDVEIASTPAQRQQGLMCRSGLNDSYGMLFEFQDVRERAFWMKDTISALDIIYIAPDGRIVSIQKNAKPLNQTPLPSFGDANGVLEINAGLSDKLGLEVGDEVVHPFFHKP